MASAISALNAKIRSQPMLSYFCSTRMFRHASSADAHCCIAEEVIDMGVLQISGAQHLISAFQSPR